MAKRRTTERYTNGHRPRWKLKRCDLIVNYFGVKFEVRISDCTYPGCKKKQHGYCIRIPGNHPIFVGADNAEFHAFA